MEILEYARIRWSTLVSRISQNKETILYVVTIVFAAIFADAFAATRNIMLLASILVILIGIAIALVSTPYIQIKDLPIKKGILYLAIIAGFTGPASLCFDIRPFSLFPFRVLLPSIRFPTEIPAVVCHILQLIPILLILLELAYTQRQPSQVVQLQC